MIKREKKPIQIALFNHKGGVSKTTTTFNLGWKLASMGKRVMLVDCDPQCNLTGMVLGFKKVEEFDKIYSTKGNKSIRDGLKPAFESLPHRIEPVECASIEGNESLLLLPGHIQLAEYEVTLGIAQELSGSLVTLQNLPGSIRYLLDITAQKYSIDIVLVDMSPSLGAINQNLLMTSDFFIIPMAPDYFSLMAINSLSSIIPNWHEWASEAYKKKILRECTYPFPEPKTRLLGVVIQRYRLRERGTPSQAFQKWIDDIDIGLKETLIPVLKECDMLMSKDSYSNAKIDDDYILMQMSDFNSLIAQSQKHKVPIFDLSDDQLEQTGIVLQRTKKSMDDFDSIFSSGAEKILAALENA